MAPEQIRGEEVDARADLFAAGAILFESLSGRPPFAGTTMVEVLYRTLHENPPALSGSPAVAAVDRVLRRALQKKREDRHQTADAFREELAAVSFGGAGDAAPARALTRVVVLPFRVLKPDPDTDFLSLGLADGVSASLSSLRTLVVRSSSAAARFSTGEPDLKRLAVEADVDLVLLGTLMRSGERLRVASQLVEAPSGTLLGSHTLEAPVGDPFELQDQLTLRIVESLALPLQGEKRRPASARAYELYLRANHMSRDYDAMPVARDLYLQSIEEDPAFAPAWARLGRAYRLIGKFIKEPVPNRARAEQAFRRALELDPDLSLAHKLYAHFEAEWGRAPDAMVRLLRIARSSPPDAELFAGLVHACRYSGLFEASLAAHEEARRLDPNVPTSLAYTHYLRGDYRRLDGTRDSIIDVLPKALGLAAQGRRQEALAILSRELGYARLPRVFGRVVSAMRMVLAQDSPDPAIVEEVIAAHIDPEALYMFAIFMSELGEVNRGLEVLESAVRGGYFVGPALRNDPLLARMRSDRRFAAIVDFAEDGRRDALVRFESAQGRTLLGIEPRIIGA
jgi:TolB-like protein